MKSPARPEFTRSWRQYRGDRLKRAAQQFDALHISVGCSLVACGKSSSIVTSRRQSPMKRLTFCITAGCGRLLLDRARRRPRMLATIRARAISNASANYLWSIQWHAWPNVMVVNPAPAGSFRHKRNTALLWLPGSFRAHDTVGSLRINASGRREAPRSWLLPACGRCAG